jgi:hypothetical protein
VSGHGPPQFLRDGKRFLYFVQSTEPNTQGGYVGSLDKPKARPDLGSRQKPKSAPDRCCSQNLSSCPVQSSIPSLGSLPVQAVSHVTKDYGVPAREMWSRKIQAAKMEARCRSVGLARFTVMDDYERKTSWKSPVFAGR